MFLFEVGRCLWVFLQEKSHNCSRGNSNCLRAKLMVYGNKNSNQKKKKTHKVFIMQTLLSIAFSHGQDSGLIFQHERLVGTGVMTPCLSPFSPQGTSFLFFLHICQLYVQHIKLVLWHISFSLRSSGFTHIVACVHVF